MKGVIMAEPICPVTKDGLHRKQVWQDAKSSRSGLACKACHRTWTWRGDVLEPTYREEING